jgi:hypothetical protein
MFKHDPLLAANIGDVLGWLIPIVFFVIYLINQLLAARGNQQQQQQQQRQGRGSPQGPQTERALRPPQQGGREPAPEGRGQTAQLNEEIEQFLKRAGQRRGENQPRERATRQPESRPRAPKQPPAPPRQPLRESPVDADVVPLDEPRRESVAASVEKHLKTGTFEKRAAHLADDIVRADQQMEEHLQTAFGRRVGTLAGEPQAKAPVTDTPTAAVEDAPSAAAAFAQILRTPQGMREAIVLGEILARPEHRW